MQFADGNTVAGITGSYWCRNAHTYSIWAELTGYHRALTVALFPYIRGTSLLDVGAADGTLTALLAPFFRTICALESSPGMLARLDERKRGSTVASLAGIRLAHMRMEEATPENLGDFDTVLASHSLYWQDDLKGSLLGLRALARQRLILVADCGKERPSSADLYFAAAGTGPEGCLRRYQAHDILSAASRIFPDFTARILNLPANYRFSNLDSARRCLSCLLDLSCPGMLPLDPAPFLQSTGRYLVLEDYIPTLLFCT